MPPTVNEEVIGREQGWCYGKFDLYADLSNCYSAFNDGRTEEEQEGEEDCLKRWLGEGRSDGVNHTDARKVWLAAIIAFKGSTTIKITTRYSGSCFSCHAGRGAIIGNLNFCCACF